MANHASTGRQPKVVVIGLGVVGSALADELTLRGLTDVTVLDQGPLYLTGGSSSHAPGFAFQTNPDRVMATLARRTLDKLDGEHLGDQWLVKRAGGLEIATTPERLRELHRRHGLAQSWGIPAEVVDAAECARLWPGLDVRDVLGGLHTPTDGVVKAVPAVQWQAERAVARGARIVPRTRVVGITRSAGRVTGVEVVPVPQGDAEPDHLPADIVVSCGGLWGPQIAREMLGFDLPMRPMEHCFGVSDPVPRLRGTIAEIEELRRPMLRHQDFSMYVREYVDRIGIGAYNHRPIVVPPGQIASADDYESTGTHPAMHPLTWDDFAPSWDEARRLLPELREVGFGHGFNGIFSFTPDGGPMLGPVPACSGLWLAQAVWVTQSAGIAQVMADWIVADDPGIDTHGLDFSRFEPAVVSRAFAAQRAEEAYDEVYDVTHPQRPTAQLRGLRTSPFHARHVELGAEFGEAGGWERPLWFRANEQLLADLEHVPARDAWAGEVWSPIAAAEAHATRTAAAMYDMTPLPRLDVAGPGATAFLQSLVTGDIDRSAGTVVYTLLLDASGGILSDVTVTRLGDEEYMIGTNGHLDRVALEAALPAATGIRIRSLSGGECGIGLWGPRARDVLQKVTDDDVSHSALRYFRAARIEVAGAPVLAQRVSYVGELGWELYTSAEFGGWVWDRLWDAGQDEGLIAAGRAAFNSLRLEKGYRLFGTDMTREDAPDDAGLGFAVRMSKADFRGRQALDGRSSGRRLACLTFDDPQDVVLGSEPVFRLGATDPVGWVTSADQGYTIGRSIAYAWVPEEDCVAGTHLEIAYFGRRCPATVQREPLYDPEMAKIRR